MLEAMFFEGNLYIPLLSTLLNKKKTTVNTDIMLFTRRTLF